MFACVGGAVVQASGFLELCHIYICVHMYMYVVHMYMYMYIYSDYASGPHSSCAPFSRSEAVRRIQLSDTLASNDAFGHFWVRPVVV